MSTRYYSPNLGRFLNADALASTGQGLLGNNMFSYCGNNPVNRVDPSGHDWWHWAAAAAIVAVAAVAVVVTAGGAAAAMAAVTCVANGVAAASTATTVAAGVFIGSSTAFAISVVAASSEADSAEEFAEYGEGALYATAGAAALYGVAAYGIANPQATSQCFIAGTLVKSEHGDIPIEELQVGDYVWAWDKKTKENALKKVLETYIKETSEFIHVFVKGQKITTTPEHPFYSPIRGWIRACDLEAGDSLLLINGELIEVERTVYVSLGEPAKVYNFHVEGYHTYYVSAVGILVHNSCDKTGYAVPAGGGGVSDSVQVGDTTVTFGHGGRHLDGTGLTTTQVNNAIANDVVQKNLAVGQFDPNGMVAVGNAVIKYTAYKRSELLINIGTYHRI